MSISLEYQSTEKGSMYIGGMIEGQNLREELMSLEPVTRDTIIVDRNYFLEHIAEIKAWALKRLEENPYD